MSSSARDITWSGGTHRFDLNSTRVQWMVRNEPFPGQFGGTAAACLKRFEDGVYSIADIERVMEIGLIGGGKSPDEAERIVGDGVRGKPQAPFALVAHHVLIALFVDALQEEVA